MFGEVEVDRIVPDPDQPRSEFDEEGIEQLAASIRRTGQIQPIGVKWDVSAERWVIVTGERRWRAAKAAGLRTIDCYFHEGRPHAIRAARKAACREPASRGPKADGRGPRLRGTNGTQQLERQADGRGPLGSARPE